MRGGGQEGKSLVQVRGPANSFSKVLRSLKIRTELSAWIYKDD